MTVADPFTPTLPPDQPRVRTGMCPECWHVGPLDGQGLVGWHWQQRIKRAKGGQYAAPHKCSGEGRSPETPAYQWVYLPGSPVRHARGLVWDAPTLCGKWPREPGWLETPDTKGDRHDCHTCLRRAGS